LINQYLAVRQNRALLTRSFGYAPPNRQNTVDGRELNELDISIRRIAIYAWTIYLHVLGLFAFLLAHGTAASAGFALQKEHNLERIRALLYLSGTSHRAMYPSLLVIVLSGILAGFQGSWWVSGWIWLSLGLLIVLVAAMYAMGGKMYSAARKAAGLPYFENGKPQPPVPAESQEEVERCIRKANPMLLLVLGYGGLALIAWLMIFKPF
jgi:hypothetical protein